MNAIWPGVENRYGVNFTVCETVDSPLAANRVGLPPQILAHFLAKIKRVTCNPGHIYAGMPADNMRDKAARGRCGPRPLELPKAWRAWPSHELRRQIIVECLASPRRSGTMMRLAREHNIKFATVARAVQRARDLEFLAATTGTAAAVR